MASEEDLNAEIETPRCERKVEEAAAWTESLKVSEKGAPSVYGLGRFPITLYREQWDKLLGMADEIRSFIRENDQLFKRKKMLGHLARGLLLKKRIFPLSKGFFHCHDPGWPHK
jgi:hypothetical protein